MGRENETAENRAKRVVHRQRYGGRKGDHFWDKGAVDTERGYDRLPI